MWKNLYKRYVENFSCDIGNNMNFEYLRPYSPALTLNLCADGTLHLNE